MYELALKLNENMEELAKAYGQRLGAIEDYVQLDETALRDIAHEDLQLITSCLQQGDSSSFIQAVEHRVGERFRQGFSLEALLEAVEALEETLSPLVSSVDAAKFLWAAFSQTRSTLSRVTEQVLRTNEANYETIFNASPVMFWLKDTENRTLRINQAAADFEGVNPDDVAGRSCYDLYPHEQAEAFYQDDLTVIRSGKPRLGIIEQHTAVGSGELMWVETGKVPTRDADGNITGVLAFAIDITERREVEERGRALAEAHTAELSASEARFRQLFEGSADAYLVLDDNIFVDCNQATVEMLHASTKEEVLSTHPSELSPEYQPDGRLSAEKADEMIRTAIERGSHRFEWVHRRVNGEDFWVEVLLTPITVGDKQIVFTVWRDITERKRSEEELHRLRMALEQTADGITITNLDGDLVFANRAWAEMHGYSVDEIQGAHLSIFHTDQQLREEVLPFNQQAMEAGFHRGNVGHVRRDGLAFPTMMGSTLLRDDDGNMIGIVGTARDITAQIQAEQALRESEQRFREFYESVRDGIAYVDITGSVVDTNNIFQEMVGYSLAELQRMNFNELTPLQWHAVEAEILEKQVLLEGFAIYEKEYIHKNGHIFPVELAVYLTRDRNGKPSGFWSFIRDITERKRAEQELLQEKAFSDTLINSLPGVFYLYDSHARLVRWNKNFTELMGYSDDELLYFDALDTICEDDRELIAARMQEVFVRGQSDAEAKLLTKHGRKIPHYLTGLRLMIGNEAYLVGTGYDITERIRLEQHVQEALERRGYQVQVSTQIAQEIAAAPVLDELFRRVVTLIKEQFGYYHTQLLRYEPEVDAVVLVSGYGETGRKMLEQGHRLPMGVGLVGASAATGETMLRPDLTGDPDWRPNPLLSETKGEIAVPIKLRDEVLGVLDVQSDEAGALNEDDRLLLEGLCGQIAIAIQRTRLIEQTRQAQERAQTILDAVTTPMLISKVMDGQIVYANTLLSELVRVPLEDLVGKPTPDFYVDLDDRKKVVGQIREKGAVSNYELRLKRSDGEEFWSLLSARLLDYEGEPAIITSLLDVTDRILAEEELRATAEELDRIFSSSLDMIGTANFDGYFTSLNPAWEKTLGYTREELMAQPFVNFVHTDDVEKTNAEAAKIAEGAQILAFENRYRCKDSSYKWVSWRATPDLEHGAIHFIARDITESKLAETLMEERLNELNTLYRATSHEGWEAYRSGVQASNAYLYDRIAVQPSDDLWVPEIQEAVKQGKIATASGEHTISNGQAAIAAPMAVRGEIIGALGVYDDPQNPLSEDDLALIDQVSDQVAQALEGARLFEQTQTALAEAQALYTGSARVIAASTAEEVLNTLVEVTPLRKLDRVYLYFFDKPWDATIPETMIQVAGWQKGGGGPVEAVGTTYDLAEYTILSQHLSTEQPLMIKDVHLDKRVDGNSRAVLDELGTRSLIFLPVRAGGVWYGVLDGEYDQIMQLSPDEIRQIRSMVDQAATVIQSLRLQQDMSERVRELTSLQRMMSREAWAAYQAQAGVQSRGYLFDRVNVKPLASEDISGDGGNGKKERAMAAVATALQDAFATRLAVRGEPIGVLGVRQEAGHTLTPEDEAFLQAISEQVAQAMERARLIEQTQKAAVELQAVADVSTATSTILNPEELLQSVVDLAKGNFGLYHAHVYLFDEAEENLTLAVGAGEIGREMAAEGWSIPLKEDGSLVASVARMRQGQIISDVRQQEGHLANPLLPDALSELAVPMVVGDNLLGVFDVQSDVVDRFTGEDVRVYGTLAAQVAVALQNAELYAEQLETVERLRELDNMKSAFLANMSHELRTPLNSILGFTQVIIEGLDGPLTDLMISDLELIEKNGKHLLNLINDVLDMAKIEAGRLTLSPEPLNLYELFDEVIVTNSPMARDKNIYMNLDVDYEDDWTVMADHVRMRQILINLVGNSLKFTDSGGITVELKRLLAQSEDEHDRIQARIIDTGIGIPPERLEDIFEAFSQVDSSTTRKAGGTGLGLPISRRLVELHGGRLWAESRGIPGEGSTLYLELPVGKQPGSVEE